MPLPAKLPNLKSTPYPVRGITPDLGYSHLEGFVLERGFAFIVCKAHFELLDAYAIYWIDRD